MKPILARNRVTTNSPLSTAPATPMGGPARQDRPRRFVWLLALFAALLLVPVLHAQEEDEAMTKMREALRNTTIQLRDAQAQIANLQAADIASKAELDKQKAEIKKLNDQALVERNASANAISELNTKLIDREAEIIGNKTAIEKWRKDYTAVIERARKAEADRDKKAAEVINLERLAEAQRFQNVQMYLVGKEILKRYDNFWFGDALLAREPFVGNTKVKLQNLAQEGQDKLLAARIQDEELAVVKKKKPEPKTEPAPQAENQPTTATDSTPPPATTTPEANPTPSQKPTPKPAATPKPAPTPKPPKAKPGVKETKWPTPGPA